MFSYSPVGGQNCLFSPHMPFKRENIFRVISKDTTKYLAVLQCSTSQENVLKNSDLRMQSYYGESAF